MIVASLLLGLIMKILNILGMVFYLALSMNANATEGFSTGADLVDWCKRMNNKDDTAWGLCVGSITAAYDMIMTYQSGNGIPRLVCTPKGITRGKALNNILAYVKAHPETLKYSLGDTLLGAYVSVYPCSRK